MTVFDTLGMKCAQIKCDKGFENYWI